VVHVLDAALGKAQVTQIDLIKDNSLQNIVRIVKILISTSLTTKPAADCVCGIFNDYINYIYSFLHIVQTGSRALLASYSTGTRVLSLWVKRRGR
jgi:hypothetical protein